MATQRDNNNNAVQYLGAQQSLHSVRIPHNAHQGAMYGFIGVGLPSAFHGKQVGLVAAQVPPTSRQSRYRTTAVVTDAAPKKKLSKVEGLKTASHQLRYPLTEELANDEAFITENAVQIMKFHGSYMQDDRDLRRPGQQKHYQFMLRLKLPAGDFPASLYQVLDDLSVEYGNNTLRATTRCAWQMHGVFKGNLKKVFSSIMNAGGSCIGACGDLSRNVVCTPAPFTSKLYSHARFISRMMGELFAPQSGAFSEIWLDGEKAASLEFWKHDLDMDEVSRILRHDNGNGMVFPGHEEPIYGETYLPRKFKIGVTVPGDNSIDIYTQDIGIVCMPDEKGNIVGYNIMVGGGMGRTHKKEATFARIADHLGYVTADKLYETCKAIVATQRDHGNRSMRTNARMKYLVHKIGIDAFRTLVEGYLGEKLEPFKELKPWKYEDWLGWHEQGDGNLFLGLFIENGRIKNDAEFRLKTVLRRIADTYQFSMVVSPNQNIILRDIMPSQRPDIEALLKEHGVKLAEEYDMNHRMSMACPALPLCGLAVTEAERHMPNVVARMKVLFDRKGVTVPITMRMTGCPNGCARPYMSEIGFVGSGKDMYQLWLGGCPAQTRLAWAHQEKVMDKDLESTLEPVLEMYMQKRTGEEEAFGDFCARVGAEAIHDFSAAYSGDGLTAPSTAYAPVGSREQTDMEGGAGAESQEKANSGVAAGASEAVQTEEQGDGEQAGASVTQSKKKASKPRLTVDKDVMERLKNIAAYRDMTASELADELLSKFLDGVPEEALVEEENVEENCDAAGQESL